jgi:hypothetical protein
MRNWTCLAACGLMLIPVAATAQEKFPARPLRILVGLACGWETIAIFSNRIPTISALCARHKSLAVGIVCGLSVHFWRHPIPIKKGMGNYSGTN